MLLKYLFILLFLPYVVSAGISDKIYGSVIISKVSSIYDADTFRVNIKDWPDIVGLKVSIRVLGIDAPEIRGKCKSEKLAAKKAKQFTVNALNAAKVIELKNIKRGKYFRLLADVYIDGESLAQGLIKAGHARLYDGGKRLSWCD